MFSRALQSIVSRSSLSKAVRFPLVTSTVRPMATVSVPAEGIVIYKSTFETYYKRTTLTLGGVCVLTFGAFGYLVFQSDDEKRPVIMASGGLALATLVSLSAIIQRKVGILVRSLRLMPNNTLTVEMMNAGTPKTFNYPVNRVYPVLGDLRTGTMGRGLKIMDNCDKFGQMKFRTIGEMHVTDNAVDGAGALMFEHLCLGNTNFKIK